MDHCQILDEMSLRAKPGGKEKTTRQAELFLFGVYVIEKQAHKKNQRLMRSVHSDCFSLACQLQKKPQMSFIVQRADASI